MRKRTGSLSLKLPGRQPMVLLQLLFYALFRERIVELCMLLSILRENFIKVMNWIYWTFLRLRKIRRHVIGIGPDIFRQYSMLNPSTLLYSKKHALHVLTGAVCKLRN